MATHVWFADSMALKSAVELKVADIIHSHGGAITLSQIASSINGVSPSPDITCLARIMRVLVRRNVFAIHHPSNGNGEAVYDLTHLSKWLLHDSDLTLAPMILMENHPWLLASWHCLSRCVREGEIAFKKAHGSEIWDFASGNPESTGFSTMAWRVLCTAKVVTRGILLGYEDGFSCIGSLVDVGGGIGSLISEIVKAYPHLKGVNVDLPHVVSTSPPYNGVSHVGGDMFAAIPNADAVIMKWILHDLGDEDCIKILRNCMKAIPRENGKVIIVDIVVKEDGKGPFDEMGFIFDLLMMAHCSGGKERTEPEWKKLLDEGSLSRYKIINIPALTSIIEAYPEP